MTSWSMDPAVVVALVLWGGLYLSGLLRLWSNAGIGHGIRSWEAASFAAGWLVLAIALLSPLHHWGEELFSAHMAQHELLMVVAAPLLVLGRPVVAFLWALPMAWRRSAGAIAALSWVQKPWECLTLPAVAWTVHAVAIWAWHVPALYTASLERETVHAAQHMSFLGSALLFWWSLLRVREGRLGRPAAVLYLFTTAVHTSLLGVLLTFSAALWYPVYRSSTGAWGLTPLEDQQLAGLIMWIPAGIAYLIAALAVVWSWLKEPRPRLVLVGRGRAVAGTVVLLAVALTASSCRKSAAMTPIDASEVTGGGNPSRGAVAIRLYGCASCHTIPGIPGARGTVGPELSGLGSKPYLAGVITNSPSNLIRWIQHPQQIDPLTAMPDVGVSESVARDIASYLYTR